MKHYWTTVAVAAICAIAAPVWAAPESQYLVRVQTKQKLRGAQTTRRPANAPAAAPSAIRTEALPGAKVGKGDTLSSISRRTGVSVEELAKLNGLKKPYSVRLGATLKMPSRRYYVVKSGDTLYALARRFQVDAADLSSMNSMDLGKPIRSGQKLYLPAGAKDNEAAKPPAPKPTTPERPASATPAPITLPPGPAIPPRTAPPITSPPVNVAPPPPPARPSTGIVPPLTQDEPLRSTAPPPARNLRDLPTPDHRDAFGRPPAATTTPAPTTSAPQTTNPPLPTAITPTRPGPVPQPVNPAPRPLTPPRGQIIQSSPPATPAEVAAAGRDRFIWPSEGAVISGFGPKSDGQHNDGINIAVREGDPVRAAADGQVVYAGHEVPGTGNVDSYGNLVLVRHPDGWVTVYAHMSRIAVRMQDQVVQGQQLGDVGQTGSVDRPQLHFEVRYARAREKAVPYDPLSLLPSRQ